MLYKHNGLFFWNGDDPIFNLDDEKDTDTILLEYLNNNNNQTINDLSIKEPPSKVVFNNLDYKNDLSQLVQRGQVRQAIQWLKSAPIILPIKQVEEIIKYYELQLIKDYFFAIVTSSSLEIPISYYNDDILLQCTILNNRFDIFEYFFENYPIEIGEDQFRSLISICANSFNLQAVNYLLNHKSFNQFSNSHSLNSILISISATTNNIPLFNYLFYNNRILKSKLIDFYKSNDYEKNSNISFIKNLKLKFNL